MTPARVDCVLLDPPIYSATKKGVVNLADSYTRVINKVRPLINNDGTLIAINNALFYSGADYLKEIEALCSDEDMAQFAERVHFNARPAQHDDHVKRPFDH